MFAEGSRRGDLGRGDKLWQGSPKSYAWRKHHESNLGIGWGGSRVLLSSYQSQQSWSRDIMSSLRWVIGKISVCTRLLNGARTNEAWEPLASLAECTMAGTSRSTIKEREDLRDHVYRSLVWPHAPVLPALNWVVRWAIHFSHCVDGKCHRQAIRIIITLIAFICIGR